MKAWRITVWSIWAAVVLVGCGDAGRTNEPMEMPEHGSIHGLFFADEELHILFGSGNQTYVACDLTEEGDAYYLTEHLKGYGRAEDALWHEPSGWLYYSEKAECSIYSCDQKGNERTLLWKLPNGRKKRDMVNIVAATEKHLLVEAAYGDKNTMGGSRYRYNKREYFAVDIATGEAVSVLRDVGTYEMPAVICADGEKVLYLQITSRNDAYSPISENGSFEKERAAVRGIDLSTGEITELATFEAGGTLGEVEGFVLDGTLYYVFKGGFTLFAVPLAGGEITSVRPDSTLAPGMDRFVSVQDVDGKVYALLWDGNTYPLCELCEWDREAGVLIPVDREENTSYADGFAIRGETYYLYTGMELRSGELVRS